MIDNRNDVIKLRNSTAGRSKDFWQDSEKSELKDMYLDGYGITEMALHFGRSEFAIINQIMTMDISPRARAPREKKSECLCHKCAFFHACDKRDCLRGMEDLGIGER